uniref:Inositol polyphosphate-related phosphatase domain-containing protein n=1 Tax=Populus trichocarpa TaxID=3694 RepID=A0A3N7G2J0_POPTR|eukprot:XP_024442165.1 type IV inositol polyphosphate 5-phosphatase 9 isoform X3 [Populus trichocarpa]
MQTIKQEVMWPKFVANKFLRKMLGSNNIVADFPNSTETMLELEETSSTSSDQASLISSRKYITGDQGRHKIFVGSWNVGGVAPPDDLNMEDWLCTHTDPADIYVLGYFRFQEVVPLNAGNIVLGLENSKICSRWNSLIREALNNSISKHVQEDKVGEFYKVHPLKNHSIASLDKSSNNFPHCFDCITSKQMVGIFITVWVRNDLLPYIQHPSVSCVGCGIMGCLGNKGSVSVRFCLHETSFCFVCSHLASGGKEGDEKNRNANAIEILSSTRFSRGPLRNLPRKILDHDQVIWLGDFNYRIYLPHTTTRSLVQKKEWNILLERDQLKAELMKGHVFQGWREGIIEFAPTYKYYQNSQVYYGCDQKRKGEKKRAPAWCDRIIWFGEGLKQKEYSRGEFRLSDHRPVRAIFIAEIEVPSDSRRLGSSFTGRFRCLKDHLEACSNEKISCNVDRTSFYSE